jgi:hypothetical protein
MEWHVKRSKAQLCVTMRLDCGHPVLQPADWTGGMHRFAEWVVEMTCLSHFVRGPTFDFSLTRLSQGNAYCSTYTCHMTLSPPPPGGCCSPSMCWTHRPIHHSMTVVAAKYCKGGMSLELCVPKPTAAFDPPAASSSALSPPVLCCPAGRQGSLGGGLHPVNILQLPPPHLEPPGDGTCSVLFKPALLLPCTLVHRFAAASILESRLTPRACCS